MTPEQSREAFEKLWPVPAECVRIGNGYACTAYHAWAAQDYCKKFEGWQAAIEHLAPRIAELEKDAARLEYLLTCKDADIQAGIGWLSQGFANAREAIDSAIAAQAQKG